MASTVAGSRTIWRLFGLDILGGRRAPKPTRHLVRGIQDMTLTHIAPGMEMTSKGEDR